MNPLSDTLPADWQDQLQPLATRMPDAARWQTLLDGLQQKLAEAPQPVAWRLALALRGGSVVLEEDQELDLAIRRWEAERRAGIAWSADFGDCWRQIEWIAVVQQLLLIAAAGDSPALPLARLVKTATRYRELAALLPLAEQLRPGSTQQGYA
jgi:hypothetical protein